jgi:hypothetical protein
MRTTRPYLLIVNQVVYAEGLRLSLAIMRGQAVMHNIYCRRKTAQNVISTPIDGQKVHC